VRPSEVLAHATLVAYSAQRRRIVPTRSGAVKPTAFVEGAHDGAVRDINGLRDMENFTSFIRYYDPSHDIGNASAGARLNSTMIGINVPIRTRLKAALNTSRRSHTEAARRDRARPGRGVAWYHSPNCP
jgi:hypothetical protein